MDSSRGRLSPVDAPMKNTSLFFIALAALVLLAMVSFFSQRPREKKAGPPSAGTQKTPSVEDQELQKFNLTGFDSEGKKFWNLEGDTATIQPGQTVYLDQNVTLRLKDDTIVRTDHVKWSQDGGTLTTDAPVNVDHQSVKIKGTGALGRPADSFLQLNRDIHMVINVTTTLTCKGPMKIYYKENKILFYRQVKVVDAKGVLTANRMDVFFDPDDKKIKQIVAMNNVVINRGSDTTRSERAIYSVETGSIRLEGNPEITIHKEGSAILDGTFTNAGS